MLAAATLIRALAASIPALAAAREAALAADAAAAVVVPEAFGFDLDSGARREIYFAPRAASPAETPVVAGCSTCAKPLRADIR